MPQIGTNTLSGSTGNSKETRRHRYNVLLAELDNERSSFISHWRDLSDYYLPRRSLFTLSNTNRGERRNHKIIDSTATLATRTLSSGMMGGITSPARPWFRLSTADADVSENTDVKTWLHLVSQRMTAIFLKSNLYNVLPTVYGDIGIFATAAMMIEEDFDDVIRCYSFPIGSYMISNDDRNNVRTFFREFRLTVRQLVKRFGTDEFGIVDMNKFSTHVKEAYKSKHLGQWVDVCHVIHANEDYEPDGLLSNQKLYRSVYFEKGTSGQAEFETDVFLSDKGYDYFPVLVPRWETTGEDVYGTNSPGMVALGDVKALQIMQKRKAQAIEKMVNPALVGPSSLRTQKASLLPGDITYSDDRVGQQGLRPIHEVNPRVAELSVDIQDHQQRVRRTLYEDLFLMLQSSDRRQITATEIDERKEEKLLALGPVLEQLNQDLLDPLIDITFALMERQGLIPPPPEEIAGQDLKVEYVSIMHQAQKVAGLAGIERFVSFVGGVAQFKPEVLDKIDGDQLVDEVGEITGVPPRTVLSDEAVADLREQRAQVEAKAQQMAQLEQGAKVAKDLSAADTTGDNALAGLIEQSQAGSPI